MKSLEKRLHRRGFWQIAGLDEAGRGAWAGPLVVALCVFAPDYTNKAIIDSKRLTRARRQALFAEITAQAQYFDYIVYPAVAVDLHNPKRLSIMGMEHLVARARGHIDYVLTDAEPIQIPLEHKAIIKGDQKCQVIAAAAIIAKTVRDQHMAQIARAWPNYGFNQHQGYGTQNHQRALEQWGPIAAVHRFSYRPIQTYNQRQSQPNFQADVTED